MPHGSVQPPENGGRIKSLKTADLSVCDEAESFLQSGFWGAFKARYGWTPRAFLAEFECENEKAEIESKPLLVLHRRLAPAFSLAYIPWGPELPPFFFNADRNLILGKLAELLRKALPKDTVFIRFDPPWYCTDDKVRFCLSPPFVRSSADIQAPDTVIVDLSQPLELIMEQMKPKWRYNARLAIKKGVTVRRAGVEESVVFYRLLEETAARDGIAIHGYNYYRDILESDWYMGVKPDIRLYLAEHDGEILAGIVTLFRGSYAVYLYGASSDKKRNLMAPYALQVKAMEDAKEFGCDDYDLFGIPPDENPSHPMAGLYRFKTGFGGVVVHRVGCWDYPCRSLVYRLFRKAEALRKKLLQKKKHSFGKG